MKLFCRMVLGAALVFGLTSSGFAAGFALIEQSVSGLGNAFAGQAAVAADATTIFFNPAGLTLLEGQQLVAGIHLIVPQAEFRDQGSALSPALGGAPLAGGDGGDGGEAGLVPNLYYAVNLENGWALGLGINAPFSLATDYNRGWKGRYHALRSEVLTVNINPSLAYRLNERLSFGAGVSAQYVDAELSSAIDFGSILAGAGGVPQANDGDVELQADDWGVGFNLGVLYEFNKNTRIGLAYRSQIKYTARGTADFSVPADAAATIAGIRSQNPALVPPFVDTDAKAEITLPDNASLSVYHRLSPQWAVMADITWTNWSTFDVLRIQFGNDQPDNVTTENWQDNWRYSVGATYNPAERLALRLGLAFDETAIPDAEHRTPRIPGEDRFWTAFGVGYRFSEQFNLDFGYAHLFVPDSDINKEAGTDPNAEDFFRGSLKGKFENSVDIASLQLTYSF